MVHLFCAQTLYVLMLSYCFIIMSFVFHCTASVHVGMLFVAVCCGSLRFVAVPCGSLRFVAVRCGSVRCGSVHVRFVAMSGSFRFGSLAVRFIPVRFVRFVVLLAVRFGSRRFGSVHAVRFGSAAILLSRTSSGRTTCRRLLLRPGICTYLVRWRLSSKTRATEFRR